eukprot:scaffold4224_cov216-Skeletonema_marinoi.AAC.7
MATIFIGVERVIGGEPPMYHSYVQLHSTCIAISRKQGLLRTSACVRDRDSFILDSLRPKQ